MNSFNSCTRFKRLKKEHFKWVPVEAGPGWGITGQACFIWEVETSSQSQVVRKNLGTVWQSLDMHLFFPANDARCGGSTVPKPKGTFRNPI